MGNPGWEGNRSETKVSGFAKPKLQALHFHSWQGPPASDTQSSSLFLSFPSPRGGAVPSGEGRRGSRGRGSGVHTPSPTARDDGASPRPQGKVGRSGSRGLGFWSGPGCSLFSPRPFYPLPHSSAAPLHVCMRFSRPPPLPARTVHAPPTFRTPWHAPPPHDPECTRRSPGWVPRAVFFPPYFPHPPRGRLRPHTRAGPGQRAGAGVHGARARGRLRVGVRGEGRGRLVQCVPGPARGGVVENSGRRKRGGN